MCSSHRGFRVSWGPAEPLRCQVALSQEQEAGDHLWLLSFPSGRSAGVGAPWCQVVVLEDGHTLRRAQGKAGLISGLAPRFGENQRF